MNEPATRASRISIAARQVFRTVRYIRSPETGLLGQGARFVIAGGIVAVVYLTLTTMLANVFGMPFQVALAIGFATALVIHFLCQRYFVWVHQEKFSLPLRDQVGRYVLVAATQYGTTAVATAFLPPVLHVPTTIVFLGWAICVTISNFIIFRYGIFHAKGVTEPRPPDERHRNH